MLTYTFTPASNTNELHLILEEGIGFRECCIIIKKETQCRKGQSKPWMPPNERLFHVDTFVKFACFPPFQIPSLKAKITNCTTQVYSFCFALTREYTPDWRNAIGMHASKCSTGRVTCSSQIAVIERKESCCLCYFSIRPSWYLK
jgi:hypothetical protein